MAWKITSIALVIFRLPPGYRFKPVTGWRIDISDDLHKVKKNVRLIVCVNLSYPKVTGENKINIEPVVANQSIFNVIKPEKKKFTLFNAPKKLYGIQIINSEYYQNNNNSSYQNNNNSSYQNNNNSSYQNNNNSSYQNNKNSSYQNNSNSSYQNKNCYNRNNPSSPLNELPFTSNNNSSSSTYSSSTRQPHASGRERYNKNENTKRSQSPEFKPSSNFIPVVAPKLLATFGIPETVLTTSRTVRSIEMEQQIVIDNKDEKNNN